MELICSVIKNCLICFILISSFFTVTCENCTAQSWFDSPIDINLDFTEANYNQITQEYYGNLNERIEMIFHVDIKNISLSNNITIHIIAYLRGFDTPQDDEEEPSIFDIGNNTNAKYRKTMDLYSSDFKPITLGTIIEMDMHYLFINFSFHTAGSWVINILYEKAPNMYIFSDSYLLSIHITQKNTELVNILLISLAILFIISAIAIDINQKWNYRKIIRYYRKWKAKKKRTITKLISIVIILAIIKNYNQKMDRRRKNKRSYMGWMTKKKRIIKKIISIVIILILVFITIFYLLFPPRTYVQIVSDMDSKMDKDGSFHIAWIKYIQPKSSSSYDDLNDFDQIDKHGSLYYTKINIRNDVRWTIPIATEKYDSITSVKLLLDNEGNPHIFWTGSNHIYQVEVKEKKVSPIKNTNCGHLVFKINGEIASNNTIYITGCGGLKIFLPDGRILSNNTIVAHSTFMDQTNNLHLFRYSFDENNSFIANHIVLTNKSQWITSSLNISIEGEKRAIHLYMNPKMIVQSNNILILTDWYKYGTELIDPPKRDLLILNISNNSYNITKIMSNLPYSNGNKFYSVFAIYNDRIYGSYSDLAFANKRNFYILLYENGKDWKSNKIDFRIWNILEDEHHVVYGIGQPYKYQSMDKDLTRSFVEIKLES